MSSQTRQERATETSIVLFTEGKEKNSSLRWKKEDAISKPVYPALTAHQREEKDWDYYPIYERLDPWYDIINAEFDLQLPRTVIRLDSNLRRNCGGYFKPGHNEFGMVMEIAVAVPPREDIDCLDFAEAVGTLAHEMLHLQQELRRIRGENNYHNRQYQRWAAELGLTVDSRGHQKYAHDGRFIALLEKHGLELPLQVQIEKAVAAGLTPPVRPARKAAKSTLKKWSCGCNPPQNAWIGAAEFVATCGRCFKPFALSVS